MAKQEEKQFNLKNSETDLIIHIRDHQQAIFSGLLSTIATDRLGYHITERTQFRLNTELTELFISELPEEKPEEPETPKKDDTKGAVKAAQ